MKILDLEQGTPEWLDFKRTHLGASDAPIICGISPYKTPYRLWKEKVLGESFPPTASMLDGIRLEPHAREIADKEFDAHLEPLCALHDDIPYLMASFDAINVPLKILVEIKCVGMNSYLSMEKCGIPKNYMYQLQQQLEICGFNQGHLLVYCESMNDHLVYTVKRDKTIIAEIKEKAALFYQKLSGFEPPEDTHKERADETWKKLASEFLKAKKLVEEAEESLKACRDELIRASGEDSCKGYGVSTTKVMTKGNVDYSKVPELKGISLDAYRKASRESWRVA